MSAPQGKKKLAERARRSPEKPQASPEARQSSEKEVKEEQHQTQTADAAQRAELEARYRKQLGRYGDLNANERTGNPAIPHDPGQVFDFPSFLQYKWVPAPGQMAPSFHNAPQAAALRSRFVARGWRFFPAEDMDNRPGSGKPWMPEYQNDNGKVRFQDQWLMYADKDMAARQRRENIRRRNEMIERQKEPGPHTSVDPQRGDEYTYQVYSQKGQVAVNQLLREQGDTDEDSLERMINQHGS